MRHILQPDMKHLCIVLAVLPAIMTFDCGISEGDRRLNELVAHALTLKKHCLAALKARRIASDDGDSTEPDTEVVRDEQPFSTNITGDFLRKLERARDKLKADETNSDEVKVGCSAGRPPSRTVCILWKRND
ncbi:unnamed protein product [Cylicostephanus goldi]|uniref:NR LBD domain-containing protein n=1 Tax=Cylicostephanus goldi TaxID=71465 RepID=A0A3P7N963_CYLGO|nr:unnamed protein product [Cylicostephanus goldi]